MIRTIACLALAGAVACCQAASAAEDARQIFDSLYGADIKKVSATPDTKDDVALAGQLLKAIRSDQAKDQLLVLMCNKAYELALKDPTGYDVAAAALQELAEHVPVLRTACLTKLTDVRLKQYALSPAQLRPEAAEACIDACVAAAASRAENNEYSEAAKLLEKAVSIGGGINSALLPQLRDKQKCLTTMEGNIRQLAAMQAKIKEWPADHALRADLVRLCLVDMDNPALAAKYLDDSIPESMRMHVPPACGVIDALAETACLDLAEWYRSLADGAAGLAKAAMLRRAESYYESYLARHQADDLGRTKATLALTKVQEALAGMESLLGPLPTWVDLLKVIAPLVDPQSNSWELADGCLKSRPARGTRMDVPVAPEGSYEVMLRFVRHDGDDGIGLTLPAGAGAVSVLLSDNASAYHGMGTINGKAPDANETTIKPGKLLNGERYLLGVLVVTQDKNVEVTVSLNGRKMMRYKGPQEALAADRGWAPRNSKYLAIGTRRSTVTFESFRLRVLAGKLGRSPTTQSQPAGTT